MELYFDNIKEFETEYVFNLYKNINIEKDYLDLSECKFALYYIFGVKIKKKTFLNIIGDKSKIYIYLNDFKLIVRSLKNKYANNYCILKDFYEALLENKNDNINFDVFKKAMNEHFPLLRNNLINECFITLDKNKDGKITIDEIEQMLNNHD
jgi:hypothetical protein